MLRQLCDSHRSPFGDVLTPPRGRGPAYSLAASQVMTAPPPPPPPRAGAGAASRPSVSVHPPVPGGPSKGSHPTRGLLSRPLSRPAQCWTCICAVTCSSPFLTGWRPTVCMDLLCAGTAFYQSTHQSGGVWDFFSPVSDRHESHCSQVLFNCCTDCEKAGKLWQRIRLAETKDLASNVTLASFRYSVGGLGDAGESKLMFVDLAAPTFRGL